jgi:hypothetical protein
LFTKSNFKHHGHIGMADQAASLAELAATSAWKHLTYRQDYPGSAHHDTRCIVWRGPAAMTPFAQAQHTTCAESYGYHEHLPATALVIAQALGLLPNREVGRIFVVSLRAGGHVTRHRDEGAYADYYSRAHVVLQSDHGNEFDCGGQLIHMRPGTVWSFNHRLEHEVWNRSDRERIHIIIDYKE